MKKMTKLMGGLLGAIALLAGNSSFSEGVTQAGRYSTVENKALVSQINPLLAVQQVHFSPEIHTVGDAVHHWLLFSGFSLVDDKEQQDALKTVLLKPLPQVVRNLGPLSVKDGLEVLIGKDIFKLSVDPLNRRVAFRLSPKYAHFNKSSGVHA